jgi:hypothetical protein
MTDTTTIEIPAEQRDELQRLKAHDREPYYEVIDRLLHATNPSDKAADVDAEVRDQLDRIEAAAKEATNAAQNAERAAEELQR